jgi:hypothetical protein
MLNKSEFQIGGINAKFGSQWSLEETRRRLVRLTRWTNDLPDLTGSVDTDQVTLSVVRLSRSNGTAFRGRIKELNDEVFLEGRFSASAYAQGTTILGLSFLIVMATGAVIDAVRAMLESGDVFGEIGFVLVFVAVLMGFGALLAWNASPTGKDVARLIVAIENALGTDAPEGPPGTTAPGQAAR